MCGRDPGCRDGRQHARHDLFDVDVPGKAESYAESASTVPGSRVVAARTDVGRVGMTICYDIRFPALFHRLSVLGTDIVVVPAAFTVPTGTPSYSWSIGIPANTPLGLPVHATTIVAPTPATNPFGLITSNGVRGLVNGF
mgnify:CR=1 FL=1